MQFVIYGMVYIGSALMVYNIFGFAKFARKIKSQKSWGKENKILYIPIVLLVLFLLGYLAVGIFGKPDLIVSGILFGGSVFVFVIYLLLDKITRQLIERERMEAELIAAEESNRAKTEFLSNVSHEMRTPMNVIIGIDSMALKDEGLTDEMRGRLEKIGASAKHLLGLINNIIDMNSIESGNFAVKNEEFSICEAMSQINAIIETLCAEKGIGYRFHASDDICGSYIGDEMRIKQVLLALLDNALKYTDPPGTVELSAETVSDENGCKPICFTIKDTGAGIDEDFLPKIFEAFSKEDASATSSRGGSGIGLTVTKSIVEQLGGTIDVKSVKGQGTEFTVVLPLKKINDSNNDGDTENVSLEGCRVLIAEDIPENAEIVADLLEIEGAESEHAENGKIAVDMLNDSSEGYYDAVLMDLRMPVMDGLTAAREIRKSSHPDATVIPIIALTANALEEDINRSLEAGMNAHLTKPADADLLFKTLKENIFKARNRKEHTND